MSALLRRPASVPGLFSRHSAEERWADGRHGRDQGALGRWSMLMRRGSWMPATAGLGVSLLVILAGIPLIKVTTALCVISLSR